MSRIAIYLGNSLPPNLVRFLSSVDKLSDDNEFVLVVGNRVETAELPNQFDYYKVPTRETTRGVGRMIAAYHYMNRFLSNCSTSVDAVWQITVPQFHAIPVLLAGYRHKVPVATRIPGNKFDEFRKQSNWSDTTKAFILNNIFLQMIRFSTLVVALSEHNRKNLIGYGIPNEKIRVLKPPLDTNQFTPVNENDQLRLKNKLGFSTDTHCVLYVGRLSELKGIDDYETVIADFENNNDYEFHFVGRGSFQSSLKNYENTVVHGFVNPADLHYYYKASDAYVHPSYIEEEGISWTMLEAAATGLPVVARDIENAGSIASFTFETDAELAEYLSNPKDWETARYPTEWSIEELAPQYRSFLDELAD